MADLLDPGAFLAGLRILHSQVAEEIAGLQDIEGFHLTEEERAQVDTLKQEFDIWRSTIVALINALVDFINLGYPDFPEATVPISLTEKIMQEIARAQKALLQLHGLTSAASGNLTLSEPVAKPS